MNFNFRPMPKQARRFVFAFLCLLLSTTILSAQSAHYVGLQTVLYTAPSLISGLAVDTAGAVYTSDFQGNALKIQAGSSCGSPLTIKSGLGKQLAFAVSTNGVVYIADYYGSVYKLTPSGCSYSSTTVPFSGGSPAGIAVDTSGNLYIADPNNKRVVKETVTGSTFVQSIIIGGLGSNLTGVAWRSNTVYVADSSAGTVKTYTGSGTTYSAGTTVVSGLPIVQAIAVDSFGNVFAASNPTIYKETLNGNAYQSSYFAAPNSQDVAVDSSGNVYSSNTGNGTLVKITPGALPTFAGTTVNSVGSTVAALFEVDSIGSGVGVVVGEQGMQNFEFSNKSTQAANYSGDQIEVDVNFSPLFAGTRRGVMQAFASSTGVPLATVNLSAVGLASQAAFFPAAETLPFAQVSLDPEGLALDTFGSIYIADAANGRILKETPNYGDYSVTGIGSGLLRPSGIAIDGAGNLYIADTGNSRVVKETLSYGGGYVQSVLASSPIPRALAVDSKGLVYIADLQTGMSVATPTASGTYTTAKLGSSIAAPNGVAVDGNGIVYVSDSQNHQVLAGQFLGGVYFEKAVGSGNFSPSAVATDAFGNLAIVDTSGGRVLEELPSPNATTEVVAGGNFSGPAAVATDTEGNLYIGDAGNHRVVKVGLSGTQNLSFPNTVVGSTSSGQIISFANIGNTALVFPSYSAGNPYLSAGFTFDNAGSCPTNLQNNSVAAGATCSFVLDFSPTALGLISGALTLVDTSRNVNYSVQGVELSGTGVTGAKTITFPQPTSPMPLNSSDTLMATTSNGDPVTYAITSGTATLNGSMITYTTTGSVTITVTSAATASYAAATPVSATVQVSAAAQTISWLPSALSIYTGTALGTGVLDATDSVPASIAYTSKLRPVGATNTVTASTVLSMGKYFLSAIVTPNNAAYGVVTSSLPFTVQNMNPFVSNSNGTVSSIYNNGSAQSSSVSGGGVGAAVDSGGFVWSIVSAGNALARFTDAGTLSTTYTNIGLSGASALAVDGLGQVWVANSNGTVSTVSNSGLALLTITDAGFSGPAGVAIDMSGNIWIASAGNNSVEEIIGGAAPVAPLANAVYDLTPATRP